MKKQFPTLIAALIWSVLYSQSALANLQQQCLIGVPMYDQPLIEGDVNSLPVNIEADRFQANYPMLGLYEGEVRIEQGNRLITADRAEINQTPISGQEAPLRIVTITGNVHYKDPQIQFTSPQASTNLDSNDVDIDQNEYQMVGRQGRGDSVVSQLRGDRYTIMKSGTFTTCLPGDNSWSFAGSTIIHDDQEQVAEIWNARFNLGPIPIFYSPYLQYPTGNKRRSGFLMPDLKYDTTNGLEITLPYYWNIAANMDATITAHSIGHRGLQWQNEFRYLLTPGSGTLALDWLPNDRLYQQKIDSGRVNDSNNDRWLFYWGHSGVLDNVWRFNIDYTKVSDKYYFNDLASAYGSSTDGYVTQKYSIGYANNNWTSQLTMKQFQIFASDQANDVYRAEPQLDINNYQYDLGPFDLHTYAQIVRFVSPKESNPKTTRVHFEPTLSYPLANRWGSLNSEVKLFATHYNQDVPNSYYNDPNAIHLKESVNRTIPQFKIDGKLVFERPAPLLTDYTQTLEPRIQYQYTPYRNQDTIYVYDATLLQMDYTGLFRERSYSGLDRIASANKVTAGLTSRVYDEALVERFNVSLGQIYHFEQSRIGSANTTTDKDAKTGTLSWAGDSYWKVNNQVVMRAGMQYDTRLGEISLGDAIFEYRRDDDRMLQLSYRYASQNYIVSTITNPSKLHQQDISQVGMMASWPLTEQLAAITAYYYDTKLKQSADSFIGFKYNTCCWAASLVYGRKIVGLEENNNSRYDNKLSFNLELRGFDTRYGLGSRKVLRETGILPYQSAF